MNINLLLIWNYFFATMIIFCRNSLYSIISLVFLIVGSSFILFSLNLEFLIFILLLVYIGAISVLFLFVIMMLQLDKIERKLTFKFDVSKDFLLCLVLILKFSYFIYFFNMKLCLSLTFFSLEFIQYNKDSDICPHFLFLGKSDSIIFLSLFSQKFYFFIIIGFILIFSMIGSIALCLVKNKFKGA